MMHLLRISNRIDLPIGRLLCYAALDPSKRSSLNFRNTDYSFDVRGQDGSQALSS